jgi:Putative MetA-pathway of phenol degradation
LGNGFNRATKSASHIKKQNHFIPPLNYLAALLLSFTPVYCAEGQSAGADLTSRSGAPAQDLTGLSLEELYNLDIIQLNVIGGHTHPAGQIMFGYEFMFMDMGGHLSGTRDVSEAEILKRFPSASTGMTVEEHMLEVMYAPTDNLTLMAMLPIKHIEMDMVMDDFRFTEHSEGIGDLQVMALYTVLGSVSKGNRLLINAGVSFPTGSIDEKNTIMGNTFQLEYPMQLGSGTYDFRPGLTYLGESNKWAWGAQLLTTLRFGRNENGYRLGNEYGLMGWVGYALTDWFAPSLRVNGRIWGNVHGADPEIDPTFDAEGDPHRQGGQRVDLLLGTNFFVPRGIFKGTRLMIEAGLPIYENLDGPQLSTRWLFSAGLTYSF